MKKEKRKKKEKRNNQKKNHHNDGHYIHSKYPKFLIYILHNRQGQCSPLHSLIFLLNS